MTKLSARAKIISVFGGSQPKPGEPAYEEALVLGKLLAEAGYVAMTGGYIGTMEAVSRGAVEADGHSIGVTCDQIEAWRAVKPNAWVQEEVRFETLEERLQHLVRQCDAAIALPGGIGTLAEIAVMFSQMQTGVIEVKPLILVGEGWRRVFEAFLSEQEAYIPVRYRGLVTFAGDVREAFEMLRGEIP